MVTENKPHGEWNIIIVQGESWKRKLTRKKDGVPVNMSAFTGAKLQIREYVNSTSVLYELNETNGIDITKLNLGEITITIPHTVTKNFNFDEATYDLFLFNTQERFPLTYGKIKLVKSVTRW